jgi:hypothetical protein
VGIVADASGGLSKSARERLEFALFDLARQGALSFEGKEYRSIRSSLERCIRFAHELTVWRYITATRAIARLETLKTTELRDAINAIADPSTRARVDEIVSDAYKTLAIMMIIKSPVFIFLALVVTCCKSITRAMSSATDLMLTFSMIGDTIQSEADAVRA